MTNPSVCIVIPVYNEVANIGLVLAELKALPTDLRYSLEIVVVDGGSRDGTVEAARAAGATVVPQEGRGYGAACYTGLKEASARGSQLVAYLDGDYSDPPASLPALLEPLLTDRADLVLGTRQFEKGSLPRHSIWGNWLVAILIGWLYRAHYRDLPSFKVVRREILVGFAMQEMTYGWTTEILVKAARAGCRVVEVPILYRKRAGGQSKVSGTVRGTVKAGYHLLKTALKYRRWSPAA